MILSPLNALAQSSGISLGVMGTALSMGLYATHTMVPPTPGPIAAAGNLGADLGMVIPMGSNVSLPATLAGWIYAMRAGSRFDIRPANVVIYEELCPGSAAAQHLQLLPASGVDTLIALRSVAMFETAPFGHRAAPERWCSRPPHLRAAPGGLLRDEASSRSQRRSIRRLGLKAYRSPQ